MPMLVLARILLVERMRKLNLHYGWGGYISSSLALFVLGWAGLDWAGPYAKNAGFGLVESFLIALWVGWFLFASFTGKDFSWRINREKILALPSPGFIQLHLLTFILGFLSFPLILFLIVAQFLALPKTGLGIDSVLAVLIGYIFFVTSVRLSASLARAVVHQLRYLPQSLRSFAALVSVLITVGSVASVFHSGVRELHPGHLYGLMLSGKQYLYPLSSLVLWTALLGLADLVIQHNLIYSGIRGPLASRNRMMHRCSILLFHPAWPGPLLRVGILGWLRSRSALLLFIWGGAYSFLWTIYSRPDDVFYFFLFIWMNLLFHSYLRGNLLGMDRVCIWFYYMLPSPIDRALSSKSLSLSLLQGCMLLSLLAAGFLQTSTVFNVDDWGRILSYAISGIVFGEICGFYFSIKYPDSIDPKSQFDGGTTVGALIVPVLQILFLFLFIMISGQARQSHIPAMNWALLLAVPMFLFAARFAVLRTWVSKAMLEDREVILKKIAG